MNDEDTKKRLKEISSLMEPVLDDTSVPRNIRQVVSNTKDKIMQNCEDINVNIATAVYMLDEVTNDINMPFHTRTEIWNIVSGLEKLREEMEKSKK